MPLLKGDKEIKVIRDKDIRSLHLLECCCNVSVDELLETGLSKNRINTYIRSGIVEYGQSEDEDFVRTTILGRNYIEEYTSVSKCYVCNSRTHDTKLVEVYNSLSETEKESWKTERELSSYCTNQSFDSCKYSTTDAAYVSDDGIYICVEIVTGNYSESQIKKYLVFPKIIIKTTQFGAQINLKRSMNV